MNLRSKPDERIQHLIVVFVLQLSVEKFLNEFIKCVDLLLVGIIGVFSGEEYGWCKASVIAAPHINRAARCLLLHNESFILVIPDAKTVVTEVVRIFDTLILHDEFGARLHQGLYLRDTVEQQVCPLAIAVADCHLLFPHGSETDGIGVAVTHRCYGFDLNTVSGLNSRDRLLASEQKMCRRADR